MLAVGARFGDRHTGDLETYRRDVARVSRAQRVLRADTTFVTAIGLYQIWSGRFQQTFRPRHYLVCGQAGPLGWEVPAATGVNCAYPDKPVVAVVGPTPSTCTTARAASTTSKLMEAFGCPARRVEQPGEIADALNRAALESEAAQLPVLVEIMVEREANAAMGLSLNAGNEFEPAPDLVPLAD